MLALLSVILGLLIGTALGYQVGWYRCRLGLPLGLTLRRKRPTKPNGNSTVNGQDSSQELAEHFRGPTKRDQIAEALSKSHPHLTKLQREGAIDEIMARGEEVRHTATRVLKGT
jgi:ATP-dependent Clp protease ATP-binding subunit ClpA